MQPLLPKTATSHQRLRLNSIFLLVCAMMLLVAGCQKVHRTSDPQLKPIQNVLDAQLPVGTPEANVLSYLNNRGYSVLPTGQQGTIVTTIRHIDEQTVTPVTARVTFYFDANHKLNNYELQRTFNEGLPKTEEEQAPPASGQPQARPTQQ